jgi:hypothetical protein
MSHNYRGHFGTQVVSLYRALLISLTRLLASHFESTTTNGPSRGYEVRVSRAVTLTEPHVQQ